MAEKVSPAVQGSTDSTDNGTQAVETKTENTEYVSKKDFEGWMARIEKTLGGQSSAIGTVTDKLRKISPPADKSGETEMVSQFREMQESQAATQALLARQRKSQARTDIVNTMLSAGVDEVDAEEQAELILARKGNDISTDDDLRATIKDGANQVSLKEFTRAFLATDRGRRLLPTKRNPSTAGNPTGPVTQQGHKGKKVITLEQQRSGNWDPASVGDCVFEVAKKD